MSTSKSRAATLASGPTRRAHTIRPGRGAHGSKVAHRLRASAAQRVLARYCDWRGRAREIVTRAGSEGSVLVIDRDASTGADNRLIAHLAPDEPGENAAIASRCFLEQSPRGRCRCRPLATEDLRRHPFAEELACDAGVASPRSTPVDRVGRRYRLARLDTGMSIPELRWRRIGCDAGAASRETVSLRQAVACLEAYEPMRSATRRALDRYRQDAAVSTTVLAAELARVQESAIVLNRALRETVMDVLRREELSMSEIAVRCGRIKRDPAGNESGETSWLARRLGLLPEAGKRAPTPWIHSDVLALIAREGLGVSPREVEVE
jgi:hypothetical protein